MRTTDLSTPFASAFSPITLDELNAKAAMMTRLDNKYIVPISEFERLVPALAAQFDVLDIDGKTEFGYQTCYFDTPEMISFRHHIQGRRQRSKVRTRHYLDADISFLEVKLKTIRKITSKKRVAHDRESLDLLPETALQFVHQCHNDQYARSAAGELNPVIKMQYQRTALVAHDGAERMTIDRGLQFWNHNTDAEVAPDMLIIETKSRFGRGLGDKILRRNKHHPAGSCSKYCVGLAALSVVPRFNKFRPAFNKLLPHLSN